MTPRKDLQVFDRCMYSHFLPDYLGKIFPLFMYPLLTSHPYDSTSLSPQNSQSPLPSPYSMHVYAPVPS